MAKTVQDLIAQLREQVNTKIAERNTYRDEINEVRAACADDDGRNPSEAEAAKVRSASAKRDATDEQIQAIDARIKDLEGELARDAAIDALQSQSTPTGTTQPETRSYDQVARVKREERTYTRQKSASGERSFFQDAYAAQKGNPGAQERQARNVQEAVVEGEFSERATTTASFAGLVVPQYLVDENALLLRFGRPVANTMMHEDLPDQGMSFIVPRGTTGAAVASQATENSSVQSTDEVWANVTVPVVTIAGQQDISRQSIERGTPGLDSLVYRDLAGAYHAELDRQVITGTGSSGQMLGILNTSSINAATAFGAPPTAQLFNSKLAGLIAAIAGVGAGVAPHFIYMNPRRWGWLNTLADTTGRPLSVANAFGPNNALAINAAPGAYGGDGNAMDTTAATVVGVLQGLPIVTDANIPTNVGTNSEDVVLVADNTKGILWEQPGSMPKELNFEQTLGNQLTVKLVVYGYAAFTAGRYPVAFGKAGGLDATATWGLVAPTF